MTISEFRSNPTFTSHLRGMLSDPIAQEALIALLDFNKPTEVEIDDAEAIASVRRHSRGVGWNNALRALLSCAEPISAPAPEQPADYKEENNLEP